MDSWQAARDEYRAHQRENSPTNLEPEREDTFHAVADAVSSNKRQPNYEHGPGVLPTSQQSLVCNAKADILFHVREAMAKLLLKTVTAQHKEVNNRLSATVELLIGRMIKKLLSSPVTICHIAEAIIDNPKIFVPTAAFLKSGQRNYTNEKPKIEEHCRQFVETRIRLYFVAVVYQSKIGEKPPTNNFYNVKSSRKVCAMATSHNSSDHYSPRHAQPAHNSEIYLTDTDLST